MQRIVCLGVALTLLTSAAWADDQAEMRALIDKAIKATGGEAKLAQLNAATFKGKGKFYGMGEGIDYTGDWALQHPDKTRVQIEFTAGGMMFTIIRVLNGDKAWSKFNDKTQTVDSKEEIAEGQEAAYVAWVTRLVPLKDKDFQLAPLGEVKIDGKPAVGVRVSHKGRRDVNLFFDKEKGLLLKVETVIKDPMAAGQEMTQEALYSEHKEVNGVQAAMKVVINRDGKKFIDLEVTEIELKEKLDDSVFGKP